MKASATIKESQDEDYDSDSESNFSHLVRRKGSTKLLGALDKIKQLKTDLKDQVTKCVTNLKQDLQDFIKEVNHTEDS